MKTFDVQFYMLSWKVHFLYTKSLPVKLHFDICVYMQYSPLPVFLVVSVIMMATSLPISPTMILTHTFTIPSASVVVRLATGRPIVTSEED